MRAGWEVKKLGDVVLPIESIDPTKTPTKRFRYVDVSSVSNETFEVVESIEVLGSEAPSRARRKIKSGDVIFATIRPTLKRIAIVPPTLDGEVCSTGYFVFRTKPFLDGRFLFYHLLTNRFLDAMGRLQTGASYPAVNDTQVRQQEIAYPPLPEQQRIIAILDEAFAGLATATANAEKNLSNAREVFGNHLNSIFLRQGDDWEVTTLGAIAEFKNGLNFTKTSKGEKIRIVGVKDFRNNFWIPIEDLDIVQIEGGLSETYMLRKNDILTVRSNGNKQLIGRCILAADVPNKTSHSGFTIRIRIIRPNVNPVYLVRYLKSAHARKALIESGEGAQINNLNQQALTALPVMLPTRERQQNIVARLDEIEAEANRLVLHYEQRIRNLAELKQSVLQRAFLGELTSPPSQALKEAAE